MAEADPRLVSELVEILGSPNVLTVPDAIAPYSVDWTGRFRGSTAAVVQPGTTDEVAAVVGACRNHGAALVPQGGNTGLVGGSVPLAGEIVLSLRRVDEVDAVDAQAGQLTAAAGVPLSALHRAAAEAGWAYGVDFASRDRATVGGSIATNAAGLRAMRYGDTRAQVVGVEAVLGDGAVVSHLRGLKRDNTGYHLPSLLCGSEGTLGVVTGARLRLVPRVDERVVALVAFDALEAAVEAVGVLRRELRAIEAIELFLADGLELVCRVVGLPPPFSSWHAAYLLVEAADQTSPRADMRTALNSLTAARGRLTATDPAGREQLWRYREDHAVAINAVGVPHKLDVAVPEAALAEFCEVVPAVVAGVAPEARTWLWGHAAEGNVHVNVTGIDPADERVDEAVLRLVVHLGGSISAEHGIGTAKRAWLNLSRSPAEIEAFRSLKRALDPDGILNPTVLLPSTHDSRP
jgi:FAD/FMN-containing dehydrogenase